MENINGRGEGSSVNHNRLLAGVFILTAFAQVLVFTFIAQERYPSFDVRMNFISDLGVHPQSAAIFSTSMLLAGILVIAGSVLLFASRERTENYHAILAILFTGIGLAGVALFNENAFRTLHLFFAALAFASGGCSVLLCSRSFQGVFRYGSWVLGGIIVIGILVIAGAYVIPPVQGLFLAIGPGFSERIVAYPEALWFMAFGIHLIRSGDGSQTPAG